ncbi:MAG: hypothetical protein ACOCUS_07080 [Polyangiales bacterium]
MGKAKREMKKARRKARGTEREQEIREAEERAQRAARRRRLTVVGLPLVTFAVAAGLYWGLDDAQAAGVTLLVGGVVFFLYGLSTLGSTIEPKDRNRAGSIDYGRRG